MTKQGGVAMMVGAAVAFILFSAMMDGATLNDRGAIVVLAIAAAFIFGLIKVAFGKE